MKIPEKLSKPIPYKEVLTAANKYRGNLPELERWIQAQRVERLKMLFERYGLNHSQSLDWHALAYALALEFVPGFKVEPIPKRRGRPPTTGKSSLEPTPRRRGAPIKWTQHDYHGLRMLRIVGEGILIREGIAKVSDVKAMEAALKVLGVRETYGLTPSQIRASARNCAKRLSDSRKSVR